ncbi:MAG: phosphodiester glycosidase family protein [Bacillota bacterium]
MFVEALGRALLTLLLVLALASQAAAAPALAGAATLDAGALGLRVRAQQRPVEAFFGPDGLYLPARNLLSALGYDVSFNQAHGTVTAAGRGLSLELKPGCPSLLVNGDPLELAVPTRSQDGSLLLPLEMVSNLFSVSFDLVGGTRPGIEVEVEHGGAPARWVDDPPLRPGSRDDAVVHTPFTLDVGGRRLQLTVLHVSADAGLLPRLALAEGHIGGVETLDALAQRHGARLAITGGFFNPRDYARSNRLPTEPWVTLIADGEVIHMGQFGGVIGFRELYRSRIEPLRLRVVLEAGEMHLPGGWVQGVNHTPQNPEGNDGIYLFTRAYGSRVDLAGGRKVVVRDGVVVDVTEARAAAIPEDGFVMALYGSLQRLADANFGLGQRVGYRLHFEDANGCPVAWNPLTAVGAGPILVDNGHIRTDYAEQGFFEPRILNQPARRLAIGILPDRSLVIAAGDGIRTVEMAEAMKRLGARWALNLDGGASAGIWYDGEYLLRPGRELNHALLLVPAP